ncbi:MAG: hypothetical protein QNK04_00840 [Myxococcota bacterium]|nr:hypothetical protein [Myxococcota bacterium]
MSTILKALRRLEDDRSALERRPLREQVVTQRAESSRSRAGWTLLFLALGGGVAVGAGVLAFLSVEPETVEPAPAVAAAAPRQAPPPVRRERPRAVPESRPAPARAEAPERPAVAEAAAPSERSEPSPVVVAPEPPRDLPPAAFASSVKVVERPRAAPRIAPSFPEPGEVIGPATASPPSPGQVARLSPRRPAPAREAEPAVAAKSPERGAPVAAKLPERGAPVAAKSPERGATAAAKPPERVAPAAPKSPEPAAPEPARVVAQAPVRPVAPEPARPVAPEPRAVPPAPAPKPAPAEAAPAPIARPVVPSVRVRETRWHPDAARRMAVVELDSDGSVREVHEGDPVGALLVTKIEPSAVVFDHDGLELRRRIGD